VDRFFLQLRTPIDFEKEVGKEADSSQMKTVGLLAMVTGAALTPLACFGETTAQKGAALFVAGFVIAIGTLLYVGGKLRDRRTGVN